MRRIDRIVVHCSATPNGKHFDVDTIRSWHAERGFKDIGYHFVIYTDGSVVPGRPLEKIGAHALGYNESSVGVCLVGGVGGPDKLNPGQYTQAQWDGLAALVGSLQQAFPGCILCGHRDLSPDLDGDGQIEPSEWIKLCPSFDVDGWYSSGMVPHEDNVYHHMPAL